MKQHVCPWWLAYAFDNPVRAFFHKPDEIFSSNVKEGMTVADIGCGMGCFSIGLAKIVKESGKVISVDLQRKMLERLENRAAKAGLSGIIRTHLCEGDNIGVTERVDFALTFWMLHETPDKLDFLKQLKTILKPGGVLLVAEPKFHVSQSQFEDELSIARRAGLVIEERPTIAFSYSALLKKEPQS